MTTAEIIALVCKDNAALEALLLHHSRQVRDHALRVAEAHPELNLDRNLLSDGAMLHDIGVVLCDAPSIHCHGTEPYIEHGRLGATLLASYDVRNKEAIMRICERHTGTGLPGYEPETPEEQVICYADKFYSKSHPERTRTPEQTAESLRKFGEEGVKKFWEWHAKYKENYGSDR